MSFAISAQSADQGGVVYTSIMSLLGPCVTQRSKPSAFGLATENPAAPSVDVLVELVTLARPIEPTLCYPYLPN